MDIGFGAPGLRWFNVETVGLTNPVYYFDLDGDGSFDPPSTTPWAAHTFSSVGNHAANLRVTDDSGFDRTVSRLVEVIDDQDPRWLQVLKVRMTQNGETYELYPPFGTHRVQLEAGDPVDIDVWVLGHIVLDNVQLFTYSQAFETSRFSQIFDTEPNLISRVSVVVDVDSRASDDYGVLLSIAGRTSATIHQVVPIRVGAPSFAIDEILVNGGAVTDPASVLLDEGDIVEFFGTSSSGSVLVRDGFDFSAQSLGAPSSHFYYSAVVPHGAERSVIAFISPTGEKAFYHFNVLGKPLGVLAHKASFAPPVVDTSYTRTVVFTPTAGQVDVSPELINGYTSTSQQLSGQTTAAFESEQQPFVQTFGVNVGGCIAAGQFISFCTSVDPFSGAISTTIDFVPIPVISPAFRVYWDSQSGAGVAAGIAAGAIFAQSSGLISLGADGGVGVSFGVTGGVPGAAGTAGVAVNNVFTF